MVSFSCDFVTIVGTRFWKCFINHEIHEKHEQIQRLRFLFSVLAFPFVSFRDFRGSNALGSRELSPVLCALMKLWVLFPSLSSYSPV